MKFKWCLVDETYLLWKYLNILSSIPQKQKFFHEKVYFPKKIFLNLLKMGCITSKTVISENPNRFDVIFADTEQTVYYNAQLEINGNQIDNPKIAKFLIISFLW